jgi:uncharacterized membrane protein YdjX (TVP38/TMEM64 family)
LELQQTFAEKLGQRVSVVLALAAVAILILFFLQKFGVLDPSKLRAFAESTGKWAPIILIIFVIIGTLSMTIPSTPAIVLLGAIYGPLLGGIYAFIAVLIGASISFFIARYFRQYILKLLGDHAEILVRFQEKYVAWVVFVTRAIPFAFSFELISYASGLTGITYGAFILATAIGIIGPIILYTTTGSILLEAAGWLPAVTAVTIIALVFIIPLVIEHYNPFGWKEKLLKPKRKNR